MKYLSLCCIIKNEKYLEEFIIYHHSIGVEHFFIYDNHSEIPLKNRLDNFYFKRICTIIDFPGNAQQMNAYNHCIKHFGKTTKWLIIIDGDEYIFPKHPYIRISDFLKNYESYQAVGINWQMFGSNYHSRIQDGFCTEKYVRCENSQNIHVKSIVQPRFVVHIDNPHFAHVKDPSKFVNPKKHVITEKAFNHEYTIDIISIHHYVCKSYEDAIRKYHRGTADGTSRQPHTQTEHSYHNSKLNEIVNNELPFKYLELLKKIYSIANTNFQIYKALNKDISSTNSEDVHNHIFNYAFLENRPCHIKDKYPNFDVNTYRNNYKDLSNLNNTELEIHYINHGVNENRVCDKNIR